MPLKSDGIRIMGFHFPIALDTTFIGSLRWAGALRLRIEEIAPTELAATVSSDALSAPWWPSGGRRKTTCPRL